MEYMVLMKDPDLQPLWKRGFSNERVGSSKVSTTFQAPAPGSLLNSKIYQRTGKITYGKKLCDCEPHKREKEGVRLTVGGDRLDYFGDVATSTADITTFKISINITLSTKDAAMMMIDI
jgi:hypothetical protein